MGIDARAPASARLEEGVDDVANLICASAPPCVGEPPFALERAIEDERSPDHVEIAAALLRDSVHEHLEIRTDVLRQFHP